MVFDISAARQLLETGGPALVAIAVLSVLTLAIILWKFWRLVLCGAWSTRKADRIVATGRVAMPVHRNIRARFVAGALKARALPEMLAREEVMRLAAHELAALRGGLRPLEL